MTLKTVVEHNPQNAAEKKGCVPFHPRKPFDIYFYIPKASAIVSVWRLPAWNGTQPTQRRQFLGLRARPRLPRGANGRDGTASSDSDGTRPPSGDAKRYFPEIARSLGAAIRKP